VKDQCSRVVLHAHSTWSYDGFWELNKIAKLFGSFGIDYVMMTEHDTGFAPGKFNQYKDECAAASTPTCTLVPGIEYSSPDNGIHILTWGVDKFLGEHRRVELTLNDVRDAGGVAIFAHPIRRQAWQYYQKSWTPLLNGMEIWNRKSDGVAPSEVGARLREETGLPATVGTDFHTIKQLFPLYHKLNSPKPHSPTSIIEAIRLGQLEPHVMRQKILDENGKIRPAIQGRWGNLESLRKKLRPR
jgi:predicted metal-dependent phosphoesterase TrpH